MNPDDYGTCYVDPLWVRRTVRRELGDELSIGSWRRGLAAHQDLYLLRRGAIPQMSIACYPWGDVDRFDRDSTIELAGWCADLTPERAVEIVELTVESDAKASCVPTKLERQSERSGSLGNFLAYAPKTD